MSGERQPFLGHAGTSRGQRSYGSVIEKEETWEEESDDSSANMRQYVKQCCNVQSAKNKFPIIKWLPNYRLYDLQCDFISGLTVALTVLPQGLAYAIIANLPQQYGLYSAFMGCFVYTILGTSKDITLGPTAIMSLMTAAFATSPVEGDATYAIILSLECGLVQLLMGICHLGILVNFISYPVINAFTSAAAITIACGQIKGILGLKDIPREFLHMIYETCKHIPDTRVYDLTMGLTCLVILILLKQTRKIKWKDPPIGTPLPTSKKILRKCVWLVGIGVNAIVVICSSGVVAILHSYGHDTEISITGDVQAGLPPFKFPDFSLKNGNETIGFGEILGDIGTGLGIVPLLGLVESIAIGKAFARQNNYKIQPNQELLAIGAANIASSFVSAYPVTGSFSRTAVNSQSGVRTPMGGVFTGGVILLSLQFLTPLFKYIPKAALSAVIISAVIQMVDYEIIPKFWRVQKLALIPWTLTFLSSFGLGIEYGILIGIGVQLLMLLYPVARPKIEIRKFYRIRRRTPGIEEENSSEILSDNEMQDVATNNDQIRHLDYIVVTFNQAIRFPSVEYIQSKVLRHMETDGDKPKSVILDCTHLAVGLDYTTIQGLIELHADFQRKGVHFAMACVLPEIVNELQNAGLQDLIHGRTVEEAVSRLKEAEKEGRIKDTTVDSTITVSVNSDSTIPNGSHHDNYGYHSDDSMSARL